MKQNTAPLKFVLFISRLLSPAKTNVASCLLVTLFQKSFRVTLRTTLDSGRETTRFFWVQPSRLFVRLYQCHQTAVKLRPLCAALKPPGMEGLGRHQPALMRAR
jgi:hypothetical protein